ncbi:MAG: FUSC family protein [Lachnospiraceae bacterium]|nr:FUSC family protein [Lachnospiraceae bacterium]
MDSIINLYTTFEVPNLVREVLQGYHRSVLIALLVIAVLNCFFGFHLRKVWGIMAGMCLGAGISAGICIYIQKTGTILYLVVILGAFLMGLLALLLYRVGLFFIGLVLVPFILSKLLPLQQTEHFFFWVLLGLISSSLTLIWERETISTITAIGGGFGAARVLMSLQNHDSLVTLFMAGLAFSIGGIFLQFQPWRSRSAWNSDEERSRDKHRHKRRMKRIRRKKKMQRRMEARKNGTGFPKADSHTKKRPTTEYIPYTTQPMYQVRMTKPVTPVSEPLPDMQEFDMQEFDPQTVNLTKSTAPLADPQDLSEIRKMISKEVSELYQDQQDQRQQLDATLDQLLEEEYRNTTRHLR